MYRRHSLCVVCTFIFMCGCLSCFDIIIVIVISIATNIIMYRGICKSRDSSVGIALGYGLDDQGYRF
jgi:hypothetical protein